MEEIEKKRKLTKVYLRSVLITNGTRGIPLRELNKQYSVFAFSNIPYEELGFSSLADFIKSVPDVASLERDKDGQLVVIAIPTEADQHIFKLTTKQRKPKKRAKPAAKLRRPTFSKKALEKKAFDRQQSECNCKATSFSGTICDCA